MKNRNENTTIIQISYRSFTIFKSFFKLLIMKHLSNKKAPVKRGFKKYFNKVINDINKTKDPVRN